jgi:hypothetical protein
MFDSLIQKAITDGDITFRFNESENLDDAEEVGGGFWYFPVLPDSTLIVDEHILYKQTKLFISTNPGEELEMRYGIAAYYVGVLVAAAAAGAWCYSKGDRVVAAETFAYTLMAGYAIIPHILWG